MYGCTDPEILTGLAEACSQGIKVALYYDPSGSGPLQQKVPFAVPIPTQGLMHKKIFIVDDHWVFLGSANFTTQSLRMHDNLVIGLEAPSLAYFLQHSLASKFPFQLDKQALEFWHLPDIDHHCLEKIIQLFDQSQESIHVAIFTFTHPLILDALIRAQARGVKVAVAMDYYAAKGAGKKSYDRLKSHKIPLFLSKGDKLLHYKWGLIDGTTLIMGSANWTQAAFQKNDDYILILNSLSLPQKEYFQKIWKQIILNSI